MRLTERILSGYKCFDKGLVNRYGMIFEVGKIYHCDKEIKFGNDGHGFHMCKNLEDTLRYFDAVDQEVDICKVKGFGEITEYEDDYNGFYDMYACEYMHIEKKLTREEIIAYGLRLYEPRINRFISLIRLSEEEKALFKEKFKNNTTTLNYISYYQDHDLLTFSRKKEKK